MAMIDPNGNVIDDRIKLAIKPHLHRGLMLRVQGIIIHQTNTDNAQAVFNSYDKPNAHGAHFLIDKDGTIYQTASVLRQTIHVGPIKARCLAVLSCTLTELKKLYKLPTHPFRAFTEKMSEQEQRRKRVPDRYPSNLDSIGIENVGKFHKDTGFYDDLTEEQQDSLSWLLNVLKSALGVPVTEIFRHPTVSRKQESEAASARW